MQKIRKILVKLVGLERYLQLVSAIYLRLMSLGFFKKKYAELHFIKTIIQPNDTVMDIGANLGYYSYFMANQVHKNGRLIAVEPIPLFVSIWNKNVKFSKNIEIHNCAIGSEKKDKVIMSIPIVNGVVRHGLTKIDNEGDHHDLSFTVTMEIGDDIVKKSDITELNYIKCDVEGYEQFVIPSLSKSIDNYRPTIQIELNGTENRQSVLNFLSDKGYEPYVLEINKLIPISTNEIHTFNQDFYFIHRDRRKNFEHLIDQ